MVKGYSRVQIALHWAVFLLIAFQIVASDWMSEAWRAVSNGTVPVVGALVWGHIIGGIAVLMLALWRLALRNSRTAPEVPPGPVAIQWLGRITHIALYVLLVLIPMSGIVAWFGGVEAAAEAHELMKNLLIALVVLHVAGALYHQFIVKDGLMDRMRTPQD